MDIKSKIDVQPKSAAFEPVILGWDFDFSMATAWSNAHCYLARISSASCIPLLVRGLAAAAPA